MLDWVNRNGKILLAVRPIQAFAGSFVSLFFAIYLNSLGLPLWQTGLVLSGGLATSTLFNLVAGYLADRMGRRRLLMFFGLMSTAAGLVFTLTNQPMILVVTAVIASMGYGGGFGAAQMLERVILAQCCEDEERTDLYAIRSTIGSLATAAGSLFTGFLVVIQSWGYVESIAYRMMFGVFTVLNLIIVFLYLMLDEEAEIEEEKAVQVALSPETKRYAVLLSILFSMDALGGAFIGRSLAAYWFFERFGLGMDKIGMIFSASSLLAAVSFMLAARISKRIGLINTMVFSHLPANLMMVVIPYMPTLETSLFFYLGRSLLSMMDVPTRQSYTMAIVKPEERSRFQALLNLPRSVTMAIGPGIAAYVMQFVGISMPFLIAGIIKSFYDIALWFTFKDIKPPEEE
ncbi:MAG: MFS transporter [Candidatus Bathyarchaeota archaeon]